MDRTNTPTTEALSTQAIPSEQSDLELRIFCGRYSSLVFLRNGRPILWSFKLKAKRDMENLRVQVSATPDFVKPLEWRINRLKAGQEYEQQGTCPEYDEARIGALTGEWPGILEVKVLDSEDKVVAETVDSFIWLAPNAWAGGHEYPELLAALTFPCDPVIEKLLAPIAPKDGEWPGYKGQTADDIIAQLTKLWDVVAKQHISYADAPKSWIDTGVGQRVRTPSIIMADKESTCLDSTLFFAAAVARMGLNALPILISGHAFLGVFLQNRNLPEPKVTSPSYFRNLLKTDELVVFETTAVNVVEETGEAYPFNLAQLSGKSKILDLEDDDFFLALDLDQLWHECGIHPIYGQSLPPRADKLVEEELFTAKPRSRMENWQLKLLDLSLRNSLLNTHPHGKSQLALLIPSVAKLEDELADGKRFKIKVIPQTCWTVTRQLQQGENSPLENERVHEAVTAMYAKHELCSLLSDDDLQKRLQSLYKSARLEMEESGANTLYIACGFLKWYRRDQPEKAILAPILLLPVELQRPSVRAGFSLKGLDEEVRINLTMLELLKTEFSIRIPELEGELPKDNSGLDVPQIFKIVRKAITQCPGWEVLEACTLGLFSFTKYLMWKDLSDKADMLMKNPVVKQIAAEKRDVFPEEVGFLDPKTLDNKVEAHTVYTPLSADSSQLAAVLAAAQGKNFVLIGPPGTGKSQTIANMIAHCLGHGRTVLFVAEKAAALGVVHKRLKRIGLEPFCLELHSNKANKKGVLAQFRLAVDTVSSGAKKDDWDESAYSMANLRYMLNQLPYEMHRAQSDGRSLYDELNLLAIHDDMPVFKPDKFDLENFTPDVRQKLMDAANELSLHYAPVASVLETTAAQDIDVCVHTLAWEDEVEATVKAYAEAFREWKMAFSGLMSEMNGNEAEFIQLLPMQEQKLLDAAIHYEDKYGALMPSKAARSIERLEQIHAHATRYRDLKAKLSLPYPDSTLDEPGLDATFTACKEAEISNILVRWFKKRPIAKWLKTQAMSREMPDCLQDLQALVEMRAERNALKEVPTDGLPTAFNKGLDMSAQMMAEAEEIAESMRSLGGAAEVLLQSFTQRELTPATPMSSPGKMLKTLVDKSAELNELEPQLSSLLNTALQGRHRHAPDEAMEWAAQMLDIKSHWRSICLWNNKVKEAKAAGYGSMTDVLKDGSVKPEMLTTALAVNLARLRLRAAADAVGLLQTFSGPVQNARIVEFAQKDDRLLKDSSSHVRQLLIQRASGISMYGQESSILQREMAKQRAHMPVRQLMNSIPHVTGLLKPCMLMSPLSAAQYLSEEMPPFDVVIFDEASQIPVWDAIGVIGRGHNAIIVGDPRQMPPTSFFSRSKIEETDDVVEQDMESILDECRACGVPEMNLTWHYRSKSESLIAFSNRNYYEGKLTTFPAPVNQDKALECHYTGGVYEPGSTKRINMREAEMLVDHVLQTLRSPGFKYTEYTSIGIVTFNSQQQKLIEDLLEKARAEDISLEPYFAENNPEALFVKNLENVQGDERGVIYFSTTYGPDAKGSMSMNFGPLNLQGGERRLNVAVTRARCGMHVFTSMKPENIDLSRTQARGAADLRAFLDYAYRGPAALAGAVTPTGAETDGLLKNLAAGLKERGWVCHTNVGQSAYRLDITVENPDIPGSTLAAIMLDGASYAASCTARDRDILRQSVLRGLGWRLLFVWGMDWWRNPQATLDELDEQLKEFRKLGAVKQAEMPSLVQPPETDAADTDGKATNSAEKTSRLNGTKASKGANDSNGTDESNGANGSIHASRVEMPVREAVEPLKGGEYTAWQTNSLLPPIFEMSHSTLQSVIRDFLRDEGPAEATYMLRRLVKVSMSPALTPSIKSRFGEALQIMQKNDDVIITAEQVADNQMYVLSLPNQENPRPREKGARDWDEIPFSELLAISKMVQAHVKCIAGTDEHLKAIATYLGISRLTKQLKELLIEVVRMG